ncbi:energy-coupling factor transporter transmembrane component T family protein [Rhodococcus artemisiae]|uniref:Energy-coupling factor transporter transmembrane component T n=1 Tax=Rhodococcus artemisiae TaxID=714159 RepID=A0ABU7L4C7_9NOCA|nr:energy-coupling factor transporter transmembrane component T [Rhodococcus artemisiae]MEE2056391.1 energy-coupling factor transporter transmembrane component T [Rhodococcus artemisiae]
MSIVGLHHPGNSPLHRMPAGMKLIVVALVIVAMTLWIRQPWQVLPCAVVVAGTYALARIPVRLAVTQLRPLLWMLAIIAVFQVIVAGWERAVVICGSLFLAIAFALLITLTTRMTDMLDAIVAGVRPLRRVGVDPDRVGLVLVMTIRCIPLLASMVARVTEARKARGLGFSLRALVVPVVVGALMTAEAMGEALAARGIDD